MLEAESQPQERVLQNHLVLGKREMLGTRQWGIWGTVRGDREDRLELFECVRGVQF